MKRIFADSSILIAGATSKTGASRAVLTMAEIGLFKILISEQVLEECQRNLYKKNSLSASYFQATYQPDKS
ncbi:MAG: PIN domain-containing protein [Microcystis sp. LE17-20D]|jgi:predicted nucleic acid-binding protein|uniref:PIN domain-containing protein n=1 Tax=Microcystis sp. TaxID=1127 RepID=UPI0022C4184B|nr:PIN domain-containing protein [Microcystis sp. LE17-20D]MCZ8067341.1 PIN domain-containing protein [Microcystis sp. LE17-20D]MCZ8163295.1 PIN domain-containing protein [Microcystis sp. LE19-196.1B]MCZ8276459.1 PIN domain-containing protein [Microcystis sp. LE19-4.1E]